MSKIDTTVVICFVRIFGLLCWLFVWFWYDMPTEKEFNEDPENWHMSADCMQDSGVYIKKVSQYRLTIDSDVLVDCQVVMFSY